MQKQFNRQFSQTTLPPSDDKRWRLVTATMKRHGFQPSALIETLHTVQQSFGYLDKPAMTFVAKSLTVPLSKTYAVATFYNLFRLKPQGEHNCVVCLGTACYIKGAAKILQAIEDYSGIKPLQTSTDGKISLSTARCLGACGIAPAGVFDEKVVGNLTPESAKEQVQKWS
jgi:bidirectional [NiFe] hydrogenase diaphorase subunit